MDVEKNQNNDVDRVVKMKNMLVSHARGEMTNNQEYMELREYLYNKSNLKEKLPNCIVENTDLEQFWHYLESENLSEKDRINFIINSFQKIIDFLNSSDNNQFDSKKYEGYTSNIISKAEKNNKNQQVFIVHGHDELAKIKLARFLEKLELEPIILHEQASSHLTIIEKIEKYSEVGFAVILYTPCDLGRQKDASKDVPRARQNVVFEHGYFIGKLGRENVVAFVRGKVETPNDISGIVYTKLDDNGKWETDLVKELKSAGYHIDLNKIY